MRNSVFTILSLVLLPYLISAQKSSGEAPDPRPSDIIGEWIIDLRPTPDAAAYFQSFVIDEVKENRFTGSFYGSFLQKVVLNKNWDKLYFAFVTEDASNEYFHSGYFLGNQIIGFTYCPKRKFAMPWTGEKKKD